LKNPKSIRRAVLTPLLLQIIVFTAAYVGLLWLLDTLGNGLVLQSIMEGLGKRLYDAITFGWGRTSFIIFAMIVYIVVIIVLCVKTILKAVRYVDMIGGSIDKMMDMNTAVPDFPPDLRDVEISLNNIRFDMTRKEQLAREAEQRKNDLVTYLAHDLKTPLTSVIGYLTLLQEAPELPIAQRAKYTAVSLDKAYRLEQLINEFFDITRFNLQSVTLERNRIDFSLMIRQMVDEFFPILAEKGLTVQADIAPGIEIVGDAGKLERVLDNLIRNAVNYSYPDTCVEVAAKQGGAYVSLSIKNKGDEIPADRLTRIFEKFFRSDAARGTRTGGAGLGLAIAKQIVELHGGTISAISNREFTEFTIVLPTQMS
jgi:two-component system sensor histidine kinase VanS